MHDCTVYNGHECTRLRKLNPLNGKDRPFMKIKPCKNFLLYGIHWTATPTAGIWHSLLLGPVYPRLLKRPDVFFRLLEHTKQNQISQSTLLESKWAGSVSGIVLPTAIHCTERVYMSTSNPSVAVVEIWLGNGSLTR